MQSRLDEAFAKALPWFQRQAELHPTIMERCEQDDQVKGFFTFFCDLRKLMPYPVMLRLFEIPDYKSIVPLKDIVPVKLAQGVWADDFNYYLEHKLVGESFDLTESCPYCWRYLLRVPTSWNFPPQGSLESTLELNGALYTIDTSFIFCSPEFETALSYWVLTEFYQLKPELLSKHT